jgi:hypothetical protein
MSVTKTSLLTKNLATLFAGVHLKSLSASQEIANLLQDYAKSHHRWQNQTGDTENQTLATVQDLTTTIEIILHADTPYAKYLELARSGKWSWLHQAIEANRPEIENILMRHLGAQNLLNFGDAVV